MQIINSNLYTKILPSNMATYRINVSSNVIDLWLNPVKNGGYWLENSYNVPVPGNTSSHDIQMSNRLIQKNISTILLQIAWIFLNAIIYTIIIISSCHNIKAKYAWLVFDSTIKYFHNKNFITKSSFIDQANWQIIY